MEYFRNIEYDYANQDDTFLIRGLQANEIVDAINDLEGGVSGGGGAYTVKAVAISYTLILTDAGKLLVSERAGGTDIYVPPNSSVAFPIGTRIRIAKIGSTNNCNVREGSGVTINSYGDFAAPAVGSLGMGEIIKIDTNVWMITGDILNDS
jgi:hypothetical protein